MIEEDQLRLRGAFGMWAHKDIARVWIAMDEAIDEDHFAEDLGHQSCHFAWVEATVLFNCRSVGYGHTWLEIHYQSPRG